MNRLRKIVLIAVVVGGGLVAPTLAQTASRETCRLSPNEFPALRGLRLGMSPDQVARIFPGETVRSKIDNAVAGARASGRYDNAFVEVLPDDYGATGQFAGVARVVMFFYRAKLVEFGFEYSDSSEGGVDWHGEDDFIAAVSEALRLPGPESWERGKYQERVLRCDGFEVQAKMVPKAGLYIVDPSFIRDIEARQQAERDERRRSFRP
jgi:hypothetical protein